MDLEASVFGLGGRLVCFGSARLVICAISAPLIKAKTSAFEFWKRAFGLDSKILAAMFVAPGGMIIFFV
ncbi:MAG: hypothetical protein DBX55_08720 [Verrucomicrobia bacterium]|nr:MAG: hypothetical protein DBX55_08720 [Verrucomicrobiota bacterium]